MRTLLATLSCLLICCCLLLLSEHGPGSLAESDSPIEPHSRPGVAQFKAELSAPSALVLREPLRPATRAAKRKRRARKPGGYLQIQIVQPVIPSPTDAYALRVFSLDGKTTVASRVFTERSFEIDVPAGKYKLIVCDADYPLSWIPRADRKKNAGRKQYFLHQETIRIHAGANTIVAIHPPQGGRFWIRAIGMSGGTPVQTFIDEAHIGTQARGRGCYFFPVARFTPVLREYTSGKQVPLAWASTDVLAETGRLESDRGYLMQNVLPAGEYELSLSYQHDFLGKDEHERKLRFEIIEGETTAVVYSLLDDEARAVVRSLRDD